MFFNNLHILYILLVIFYSNQAFGLDITTTVEDKRSNTLPKYFYKILEGDIGTKAKIRVDLIRDDTLIKGWYYRDGRREPIEFTSSSNIKSNDSIFLDVYNIGHKNNVLDESYFSGEFINNNKINGIWTDSNARFPIKFELNEIHPAGTAEIDFKEFKQKISSTDSSINFSVRIRYPELVNFTNKDIGDKINHVILSTILHKKIFQGDPGSNEYFKSLNELADTLKENFTNKTINRNTFKSAKEKWEYNINVSVEFNSNNILSISNVFYEFTGGNKGKTYTKFINFDLRTGEIINLDDILKENYSEKLNKIGEAKFRDELDIASNEDFRNIGIIIKNKAFHLNKNYLINFKGIWFQFNNDEIDWGDMSVPEVFISFYELKPFLKKDGMLKPFINTN